MNQKIQHLSLDERKTIVAAAFQASNFRKQSLQEKGEGNPQLQTTNKGKLMVVRPLITYPSLCEWMATIFISWNFHCSLFTLYSAVDRFQPHLMNILCSKGNFTWEVICPLWPTFAIFSAQLGWVKIKSVSLARDISQNNSYWEEKYPPLV